MFNIIYFVRLLLLLSFFVDDKDKDWGDIWQEENPEDFPVLLPFDNFIDEKGERYEDVEFDLVGGLDHGSNGGLVVVVVVVIVVSVIASCNSFFNDFSFDLNMLFLFIGDDRCPENCCCCCCCGSGGDNWLKDGE